MKDGRFGFEETVYLLLFGELPDSKELEEFNELLASSRVLPRNFVRDVVMKAPNKDIMNSLARSVPDALIRMIKTQTIYLYRMFCGSPCLISRILPT